MSYLMAILYINNAGAISLWCSWWSGALVRAVSLSPSLRSGRATPYRSPALSRAPSKTPDSQEVVGGPHRVVAVATTLLRGR